ncbi:Trihelix transcription factor GT-3b [Vitis vinifera]|uniref:Trihelix transcription factor GT-3b n=1 Tax=Vitis vinifera TaxID=29760 RepID=A0A438DAM6_VITVI|nr:Trihelix transcription factor GT-3b [Vitis vinifera]
MEGHHISVHIDTGDRFPQWSIQETKEFLMIRAELDRTFMETKRKQASVEVIANKMKEKGYNRSADQCKCKWKNLVTQIQGCKECCGLRQKAGAKKKGVQLSSEDEDENEESEGEKGSSKKKKKGKTSVNVGGSSSGGSFNLKEVLEDFMKAAGANGGAMARSVRGEGKGEESQGDGVETKPWKHWKTRG